jgi:hypothetical protein
MEPLLFVNHAIRRFATSVTANVPIQLRLAITEAPATCGDVGFRKKPLRSVSRSQGEVPVVLKGFRAAAATRSGTIVGTTPLS